MNIIKQGAYITIVERINDRQIKSTTSYLTTEFEGSAKLILNVGNNIVDEAEWSVHRVMKNIPYSPDFQYKSADLSHTNECSEGDAPELIGKCANNDAIKALRNIRMFKPLSGTPFDGISRDYIVEGTVAERIPLSVESTGIVSEMIMECIRSAAFMTGGWLMRERGFANFWEHEDDSLNSKHETCRAFHNNRPDTIAFGVYSGMLGYFRKRNIYNKYKSYIVEMCDDGLRKVIAIYNDSYHEMSCMIKYDGITGIIIESESAMIRVPYEICREVSALREGIMNGKNIYELNKKTIGELYGTPSGCFHLVDIVFDAVQAAAESSPHIKSE